MKFKVDIDFIRAWADVDNWSEVEHEERIGKIAFRKGKMTINVFMTKGTVVIHFNRNTRVLKNQHQHSIADLFQMHVDQIWKKVK